MTRTLGELNVGKEIDILYRGERYPSVYLGLFDVGDLNNGGVSGGRFVTVEQKRGVKRVFSLPTDFIIDRDEIVIPSVLGCSIIQQGDGMYEYYLEKRNQIS